MAKKVLLTQEGYDDLVKELEHLKSVTRIEIAERLKAAIALGDLSENSEYVDAKNEQAFLEGKIQELETKIQNSEIIQDGGHSDNIVSIGSKVLIKDVEFGDEEVYMIVGSTEADPDKNKISNESPVGAAVIGRNVGETVSVHAPAGVIQYEIVKIVKD